MVGEDALEDSGGLFCSSCGAANDLGANFCAGCGSPLSPGDSVAPAQFGPTQEVYLEFVGTGLQALGWGLWATFLGILIIPYSWGLAVMARWYVKNLSFSDGTRAHFAGTGGQIWWVFLLIILSLVLSFIPLVGLLAIFGSYWIYLLIYRWFFRNIVLSTGESLTFVGGYWPLLGYSFLLGISIYSIIGWAWAATALMRWFCRNISIPGQEVVFVGKGWDVLWRGFVAILAGVAIFGVLILPGLGVWYIRWILAGLLLIITIPWLWVWYLRWVMRNVIWLRPAA